ncbi:MAG: hypothetical protein ACREX3_00380 [Gammaproteobacteria bacterium]
MDTPFENPTRPTHLTLLTEADVERIELVAGSTHIGPPGFGTRDPAPPYRPGPTRRLPKWAPCQLRLVK